MLVRFVIRTSAALGPDGAARLPISPWEPETAWLRDEVRSTHIGRGAAVLARAVWRVWTGASARRVLAAAADVVRRTALPDRVRAIGIWAFIAALTDAALTPLDPRPATVSRWTLWAGVVVLGATAAIFGGQVATAWTEWRARRLR